MSVFSTRCNDCRCENPQFPDVQKGKGLNAIPPNHGTYILAQLGEPNVERN